MPSRRTSQKDIRSLAAEIFPDDGIDPRELARGEKPKKGDRKVRQLCAQVSDTLSLVLSGEFGDSILQSLRVVAVDPAPDASQLVVTVHADLPDETTDPSEVLKRLKAVMGKLRVEVAAAITRKKAPRLLFRVL
jgi:ribosome-binding factor A